MYFETGQGSEFTYGKHNGIDMTTTEALCYGLARRYDPFMVNNVTGFIGPETHLDNFEMILANLQDHFMGKLLGLPMGMAPCYTLHSQITLEGQQMATQLLTAAGANYYMDVCLNTDRMLAYFDTSGHDDQTLREIYGRRPAPEFLEWALDRGIFAREGDRADRARPELGRSAAVLRVRRGVARAGCAPRPRRYGFATAGPRPANDVSRQVRLHQAVGREAIHAELRRRALSQARRLSRRRDPGREQGGPPEFARLGRPTGRRRPCPAAPPKATPVQIVVSDGLSAEAVHHNCRACCGVLDDALAAQRNSRGPAHAGALRPREAGRADRRARSRPSWSSILLGERPGRRRPGRPQPVGLPGLSSRRARRGDEIEAAASERPGTNTPWYRTSTTAVCRRWKPAH